jgi:hypothetical protein
MSTIKTSNFMLYAYKLEQNPFFHGIVRITNKNDKIQKKNHKLRKNLCSIMIFLVLFSFISSEEK